MSSQWRSGRPRSPWPEMDHGQECAVDGFSTSIYAYFENNSFFFEFRLFLAALVWILQEKPAQTDARTRMTMGEGLLPTSCVFSWILVSSLAGLQSGTKGLRTSAGLEQTALAAPSRLGSGQTCSSSTCGTVFIKSRGGGEDKQMDAFAFRALHLLSLSSPVLSVSVRPRFGIFLGFGICASGACGQLEFLTSPGTYSKSLSALPARENSAACNLISTYFGVDTGLKIRPGVRRGAKSVT